MVLSYNGSTWVPVSAASIAIDVDLGYTPAPDKGTVTNTAGDGATIPLANGTNAGLTLNNYTTTEKDKLAGIEDGAEANVGTDLGYTPAADKGTVTSTTGSNAEIPLGNGTNAGLSLNNYTTAEKNKLAGYPGDSTAFVKVDDGGTKQTIVSAGLGLGLAPNNLHWDFTYQPGGNRPIAYFNTGTAEACDLQVGQATNVNGNHGINLFSGDGVGDSGNCARITLTSPHTGDNDYTLYFTGGNPAEPKIIFGASGRATFEGEIDTPNDKGFVFEHSSKKLKLQSQNLSQDYAIRFPPAPAAMTSVSGCRWY